MSEHPEPGVGGYPSSAREASTLPTPPSGPAPGMRRAAMSEHPELREALADVLHGCIAEEVGWDAGDPMQDQARSLADALLAGPVGKLQAELADPERIRREAIGARALSIAAKARPEPMPHNFWGNAWAEGYNKALDTVLAAGESAVAGEAP